MSAFADNTLQKAMFRRWMYMVIAIVAAALMPYKAPLSFQEDKGIIYVRSFSMNQNEVVVTQTDLKTGAQIVTGTVSVKGLNYCQKFLLFCCIACLLCFFSNRWRMLIATFTSAVAGVYFVLLIYYAIHVADVQYATLYPNYMIILPAIILQMMVLTRHNIIHMLVYMDDIAQM